MGISPLSARKIDPQYLHFHRPVTDLRHKAEKSGHAFNLKVAVSEHVAPVRNFETVRPRSHVLFGLPRVKVSVHVVYAGYIPLFGTVLLESFGGHVLS